MFYKVTKTLEHFELGDWTFVNKKSLQILKTLSPEEQVEFDCDVNNIEWESYLQNYARGIQIYAAGQD